MLKENKRKDLIKLLKNIPSYMENRLNSLKEEGNKLKLREDLLWYLLLRSMSTMGNSIGFEGLINNINNFQQVSFESLLVLNNSQRLDRIKKVLKIANVYDFDKKSIWLNKNFQLIKDLGGLKESNSKALSLNSRESKINFMLQFSGIGDKYARNIWMDLYDKDFYDSIAVDYRIKKITDILGYSFDNYQSHEKFYLEIAKESGLTGWDLDRLLYNYNFYFLTNLS